MGGKSGQEEKGKKGKGEPAGEDAKKGEKDLWGKDAKKREKGKPDASKGKEGEGKWVLNSEAPIVYPEEDSKPKGSKGGQEAQPAEHRRLDHYTPPRLI